MQNQIRRRTNLFSSQTDYIWVCYIENTTQLYQLVCLDEKKNSPRPMFRTWLSCHQRSHRQPLHTTRFTRVLEPSRRQRRVSFAGWHLCGVSFVLVLRGLIDFVRLRLALMGLHELHVHVLAASSYSRPRHRWRHVRPSPFFPSSHAHHLRTQITKQMLLFLSPRSRQPIGLRRPRQEGSFILFLHHKHN